MCDGENWHEQGDFDTILKDMEENYAKGTKDAEALEALHNLRHFISGPLGNPPLYQPVCFYATRNCQDETGNYDEMYTEARTTPLLSPPPNYTLIHFYRKSTSSCIRFKANSMTQPNGGWCSSGVPTRQL